MPPTPTPLPEKLADSEGVTISTLCLNITQDYPQFEEDISELFHQDITMLFNRAGIIVLLCGIGIETGKDKKK